MKKVILMAAFFAALASCGKKTNPVPEPGPEPPAPSFIVETPSFAKGADISWVTEMEKKNYKFYSSDGSEKECTSLMKELGCNAVRYRVWVNPKDGWCNKADVLAKAKRAQALGMAIMIDFHYSDSWADPGKQTIPSGWPTTVNELQQKVEEHTHDVLKSLYDSHVGVNWVQIGNETNTGMLWPAGEVSNANFGLAFAKLVNAGYAAVKAVYPNAQVILHHSNAQDLGANTWFYNLVKTAGAKFDMIGLSLYPSYWADGKYPDWKPYCQSAVSNFQSLYSTYKLPVMLVEFGMPQSQPDKARAALQYVLDGVKSYDWFKGVFYWEPESEPSRNGYDYGCFSAGKSTGVIDLFK